MRGLVSADGLDAAAVAAFATRGASLLAGEPPLANPGPVALVFAEPSTRTRVSFAEAVSRLGGRPITLDEAGSGISKGESMEGTARTLATLGVNGLVLRTGEVGLPARLLAADLGLWVVNAGDGSGEHPTQALGDTLALSAHGGLEGRKVALIGDLAASRVAHSLEDLWLRLGVEMGALPVAVGSPDLSLGQAAAGLRPLANLEEAQEWADVLYLLRPQTERLPAPAQAAWEGGGRAAAYFAEYGLKALAPGQMVMAPGPCWPGVDMAPDLLHGEGSLVSEQVRWGLAGRLALLERLAGG